MRAFLLLLPIVSTSAGFLSGQPPKPKFTSSPSFSETKVPPVNAAPEAALARATPATIARSAFVPVLSYGGLAAAAVGAGKLVGAAGYAGSTVMGVPIPLVTLGAVAAPAVIMWLEMLVFGGGERIAKLMGGEPADASLVAIASDVARRAGLEPPAHVFEIPTDELNAFAAGFGRGDATVAVTSGLRQRLNKKELEAVIAHEIGHIRHSDMRTNMHVAVAIAGLGGIYELGRFLIESDSGKSSESKDDESGSSSLPLGLTLMAAGVSTRVVAQMLKLSMSRSAEFDADSVAADLVGGDAMISALSKIQEAAEERRFKVKGGSWFSSDKGGAQPALSSFRGGVFAHAYISDGSSKDERAKAGFWSRLTEAFATHPSTERRIAALRAKGR